MTDNFLANNFSSSRRWLWLQWVGASTFGWIFSWGLVVMIVYLTASLAYQLSADAMDSMDAAKIYLTLGYYCAFPVSLLAFGVFGGLLTGALQWLILRRYISLSSGWIVRSATSWTIGLIATAMIGGVLLLTALILSVEVDIPLPPKFSHILFGVIASLFALVGGVVGGFIIGKMQFTLLQPHTAAEGKHIWVLSNSLSLALAVSLTMMGLMGLTNMGLSTLNLVAWSTLQTFIGAMRAAIIGFILIRLLKHH